MSIDGNQPPAKRLKVDFKATVEVLVGQEKALFVIYKDIITERSSFFRAACSEKWKEEKGQIELPSDRPETFNDYLARICFRNVADQKPDAFLPLIEVYVLADKLGDWQTANDVTDSLLKFGEQDLTLLSLQNIQFCYSNSVDGSPLRRLLVNVWAAQVRLRDHDCFLQQEELPAEFIRDLASRFITLYLQDCSSAVASTETPGSLHALRCEFHLHEPEHTPKVAICTPTTEEARSPQSRPPMSSYGSTRGISARGWGRGRGGRGCV